MRELESQLASARKELKALKIQFENKKIEVIRLDEALEQAKAQYQECRNIYT